MNIYLFDENRIITFELPVKRIGNFWLKDENNKNVVNIYAESGQWRLKASKISEITDSNIFSDLQIKSNNNENISSNNENILSNNEEISLSYSKNLQNEEDVMNEYKNKISGDRLEFNIEEIQNFIDDVFNTTKDEDFKNIVLKNRYWTN